LLYDDDDNTEQGGNKFFWYTLEGVASSLNVKVVLAAAYGSGTRYTSTPRFDIEPRMIVSTLPLLRDEVSLQLTTIEQIELWQNFVKYSDLALDDVLGDYLFNACAKQLRPH
jgi:hypothetical protein